MESLVDIFIPLITFVIGCITTVVGAVWKLKVSLKEVSNESEAKINTAINSERERNDAHYVKREQWVSVGLNIVELQTQLKSQQEKIEDIQNTVDKTRNEILAQLRDLTLKIDTFITNKRRTKPSVD